MRSTIRIEERSDALQLLHLWWIPSKLLTATTCGPAPIAKSISVTAGMSEMILWGRAGACAVGRAVSRSGNERGNCES